MENLEYTDEELANEIFKRAESLNTIVALAHQRNFTVQQMVSAFCVELYDLKLYVAQTKEYKNPLIPEV